MVKIVPINKGFENPKAFLHHIAEDENIEAIAIMTFTKDGEAHFSHINCAGRDLAFTAAVLLEQSTSA